MTSPYLNLNHEYGNNILSNFIDYHDIIYNRNWVTCYLNSYVFHCLVEGRWVICIWTKWFPTRLSPLTMIFKFSVVVLFLRLD